MKASPVSIGAIVGAVVGTVLLSPIAVYYLAPALVLSATVAGEGLFTGALLGACLLAGALAGACLGSAFGCTIAADRRSGGFRCGGNG
ncbi:hypothetical protein ACFXNW_18925 [Nocardia sp. NPDC059180]|uniref:hypothetical protein n=1 Tax=Nocardia sp. NPDC059180 TaxID=3346761 RepID=UPI00369936F0